MIEFYAPWCPACRALQPRWDQLARDVKAFNEVRVRIAKCDVTDNPWLTGRMMIASLPTIFHIKVNIFFSASRFSSVEAEEKVSLSPPSPFFDSSGLYSCHLFPQTPHALSTRPHLIPFPFLSSLSSFFPPSFLILLLSSLFLSSLFLSSLFLSSLFLPSFFLPSFFLLFFFLSSLAVPRKGKGISKVFGIAKLGRAVRLSAEEKMAGNSGAREMERTSR